MTSEEAKAFEYHSKINAAILKSVCPKCKAYKDWFTYGRWHALEKRVKKGEHGTKLETFVKVKEIDSEESEYSTSIPHVATVFCRHQIA